MTTTITIVGDTRRLDRLLAERRRIDHEIAAERRRLVATDPHAIVEAVADFYELPIAVVIGASRQGRHVKARRVAAWLLRQQGLSLAAIGNILGRDHSTVLAGLRAIDKDTALRAIARQLLDALRAEAA